MGLFGATFIVLLVLKLTGLADISWWWVFSPMLIAVGLGILGAGLYLIAWLIARRP